MTALHLTDAAQVILGISHLVLESESTGLLLCYFLKIHRGVKLDFVDSIRLSENGCLE